MDAVVTLARVEETDGLFDVLVLAKVLVISDFAEEFTEADDTLDVVKEEEATFFVEVESVVLGAGIFDEVGAM